MEAQTEIAVYFMRREPVEVYTDVYSGTKLKECAQLQAAMRYCKENDYLLVVAKTDRIRNTVDGLSILDDMGEKNVYFCDIATSDRTILTMMFAMWERQAIMGRINTKLGLSQCIKKRDENGGWWVSKAGNVCTHLGNGKGCDTSAATVASNEAARRRKDEWKRNSPGYQWAMGQVMAGRKTRQEIIDEFNGKGYTTREGGRLTAPILSRWAKELKIIKD